MVFYHVWRFSFVQLLVVFFSVFTVYSLFLVYFLTFLSFKRASFIFISVYHEFQKLLMREFDQEFNFKARLLTMSKLTRIKHNLTFLGISGLCK